MSPEVLAVVVSGSVIAVLAAILLSRRGDRAIAGAGTRLFAALDHSRLFGWTVTLLTLFFFTLQVIYALRMPLADDEFAGAHAAWRVSEYVPYVDFVPYKTVLGYYVQALPLLLTDNLWGGILLIRSEMALINSLAVLFVAFRLRRHFRGSAVCLGLALLVVMSTFVERSYVLRVDMLGSLLGLLSLLMLLERRPGWAGTLAGLGFLTSQKSIYFFVAGGGALGLWWLLCLFTGREDGAGGERHDAPPARRAFVAAALFGIAAAGALVAYFGFWTLMSSFDRAVLSVFRTSADIGLSDRPYICPREFWTQTLSRNPGFYGAAAIAWLALVPAALRSRGYRDWLLLTYGGAMIALCVWHKQPCPYFFVVLIPTLFVLIVDLFDRLAAGAGTWSARALAGGALLYLAVGLVVPLGRLPRTLERDNGFQGFTVQLADALVEPTDGYLATLPILYDRVQGVAEFRWLDDLQRRRLAAASPDKLRGIVERMDRAPIKLLIMNYRLEDLPTPLTGYLVNHFMHFWGNVLLYAPLVDQPRFRLHFDGLYQVDLGGSDQLRTLDGRPLAHGERLRLAAGEHEASGGLFRLRFLPETLDPSLLDPRYRQPRQMFAFSFHY